MCGELALGNADIHTDILYITTDLNTKIRHALLTLADDIKLRGITGPEKVL